MGLPHIFAVLLGVVAPFLFVALVFLLTSYCKPPTFLPPNQNDADTDQKEHLLIFPGGEGLTVPAILDAPGEVVGKSGYGTLYRAEMGTEVVVLRFLRPACVGAEEVMAAVEKVGAVRHPNLVPLIGLYVGPRRERLLVYPFFPMGSLGQFIRDGSTKSYRWEVIYRISLGIARGIDHLHNALQKPIVHGNLKSKNILFDANFQPRLSDFGLHLLLNSTSAQEILDSSASQGYKAPELIKMKDASKETDIYSLGVIFLEMLTQKEPTTNNLSSSWELHLPTSVRNLALERKLPEIFSPQLLDNDSPQSPCPEDQMLGYLQLAMTCCSPSPKLRPDVKQILKRLEDIGRESV